MLVDYPIFSRETFNFCSLFYGSYVVLCVNHVLLSTLEDDSSIIRDVAEWNTVKQHKSRSKSRNKRHRRVPHPTNLDLILECSTQQLSAITEDNVVAEFDRILGLLISGGEESNRSSSD